MFKTIRSKLLTLLLLFVFTTIFTSVLLFNYYEGNKESLSGITQRAENTHLLLLEDLKVEHDFFENETINPSFFITGKSNLVRRHNQLCEEVDESLANFDSPALGDSIGRLKKDFEIYKLLTTDMYTQILQRGFKDYGVEGKMRIYAHDLENYQGEIGLVNILQLRRHEKDFIIRQEDPYIVKHNNLVSTIKENLANDKAIAPERKNLILKILGKYSSEFNNLVVYEKKLGLKSGKGLKAKIDHISNKIEKSLATLVGYSQQNEQRAMVNIRMVYVMIGLVFMVASIVAAWAISKRVSRSITFLNRKIDEFVKSDFTVRSVLPVNNSTNEVDVLTTNFSIMEQHIVDQMGSLKQSNAELETLFYITSHDIRSPLVKVRDLTQTAMSRTAEPETKASLGQIDESWKKLITIVDELGIVTSVKRNEIKTEPINLDEVIRSVYSEFSAVPGFESLIFSLDINTKSGFISAPALVKAIFRNLIENSIKYSVSKGRMSFLRIAIADQNDDMLRIEVADNGIGIKKEHQDKVFDMFYRGTNHASGTGLGLYIVACSVEKLHGAIGVESEENKGTTFTLLLPNNYQQKNIKERIIHKREMLDLASN